VEEVALANGLGDEAGGFVEKTLGVGEVVQVEVAATWGRGLPVLQVGGLDPAGEAVFGDVRAVGLKVGDYVGDRGAGARGEVKGGEALDDGDGGGVWCRGWG
jgi:hypothetical protein